MSLAVTVLFEIWPQHWDEFIELVNQNAKTSLKLEKQCHQFDVCTDEARPHMVFLYEIYESPAAFNDHLDSEHFKTFDAAVTKMIKTKDVKTYRTVK